MAPKKNKKRPKGEGDAYKVHTVNFRGRPSAIVCRSKAGDARPRPLLGLCNLLVLRTAGKGNLICHTVNSPDGTKSVSHKKLQTFVCGFLDSLLDEAMAADVLSVVERDDLVEKYKKALDVLGGNTGLLPLLSGIRDFEGEILNLFHALSVPVYHGFIPDPKDTRMCSAINDVSPARLARKFQDYELTKASGQYYEQSYHDEMLVVKEFVINGPQLTSFGLRSLREEAPENDLFLLHMIRDLHVVYKKDGQLYLLANDEDLLDKHADITWIGLDENFNAYNLAETKAKLTSEFSPVNETWSSAMTQLLDELEKEKSATERKYEEKAQKTVASHEAQTKENTDDNQGQTVDHIVNEKKQSKVFVEARFLRFRCRRVVTFLKFTSSYTMYKLYNFEGRKLSSTSYLGRLMAKGYLLFIIKAHKARYSWNGEFREDEMMVELELVDDAVIGEINCFIISSPQKNFNRTHGKADLETYVKFLFPHYLSEGFQKLPYYFVMFEADIKEMPNYDDKSDELEKFQEYMAHHFFLKAPLVRSTLLT